MKPSTTTPKGNGYIAIMSVIIIGAITTTIVYFASISSEQSVQSSLQLEISQELSSSLRAGSLKTEKPPEMSKTWGEGKIPDPDSTELPNIYDAMSSINY